MNFGCDIDDDFFAESEENNEETSLDKAVVKICQPKWFLEDSVSSTDKEETLKALRYKADYLYFAKRYAEAREAYQHCLELIPSSNIPASREVMEGLIRSLLRSGDHEKALELAFKMYEDADSTDQQFSAWNLLATVCHVIGKYEEELEALHSCLEMYKNDPEFWLRLSFCYAGLFGIRLPGFQCNLQSSKFCCNFKKRTFIPIDNTIPIATKRKNLHLLNSTTNDAVHSLNETTKNNVLNHNNIDQPIEKCEICNLATQVITACLLRTRILMAANSNNTSAINRRRIYLTKRKVNSCLSHMKIDQMFIDEATKLLKSEMYGNPAKKDELKNHSIGACADNSDHLLSKGLKLLKL